MEQAAKVACQAAWEVCPAVVQAVSQALVVQAVLTVATMAQLSRRSTKPLVLLWSYFFNFFKRFDAYPTCMAIRRFMVRMV